jgi:hypothetical protein
MTGQAKRIGRPPKAPASGKRVSLGLKVRAEVKRLIDQAAQDSGRTQSQEAEALIEKALTYDSMLSSMKTSLAEIENGNLEAAFRRAGYAPIRLADGTKGWVPEEKLPWKSGFLEESKK